MPTLLRKAEIRLENAGYTDLTLPRLRGSANVDFLNRGETT
jgi:hypothetical protein